MVACHQSCCLSDVFIFQIGMDKLSAFLRKKSFGTRINNKLYCSAISKAAVLKKFPFIPDRSIVGLKLNEPKLVYVYDGVNIYSLKVTGLPSNHCPGSLMFMFERLNMEKEVEKRILYTGDFRFDDPSVPLTSLQSLHLNNSPLPINELYLDTKFCSPNYLSFPTRKNAEEKIWQICQRWIRKNGMFKDTNPQHVILLDLPPRFGSESILQKIYQKSLNKWRVHVSGPNLPNYLCSSSISTCTDTDASKAPWIHACKRNKKLYQKSLPCQAGEFEVCQIKPNAAYFSQSKMAELEGEGQDPGLSVSHGGTSYRVCYSNHSSLTEIEHFVRYLRPQQITPCAMPFRSTKEDLQNILASFLEIHVGSGDAQADQNTVEDQPVPR